jgi:TatD DNase family protein
MTLIDTHSHIYDEAFDGDRDAVVARAVEAGVGIIMLPAIDSESHEALFDTCRRYAAVCRPMMGLHPTSVNDNPNYMRELELVERYLAEPPAGIGRFYAIGEVGLDYYWSGEWKREQEQVFRRQIELSLQYALPLVIHTRSAWDEMVGVLAEYGGRGLRGVMHSFSGEYRHYEQIRAIGDFRFGIGGPLTYKNSTLPEVVARMNPRDIVLETDSPYLPPVPYRGKRNESAYITLVCNRLAELLSLTPSETASLTTRNAQDVFGV